jgi:xylonate dehydratase
MVLVGIGPSYGMPETYQVTAALKYVDGGGRIPLVTDGRFSGVSTGPCVGHVSPEAAAGGPIGLVRDGDPIRIVVDTRRLTGTVDLRVSPDESSGRTPVRLNAPDLPDDTRLWAALQAASGGAWGGCVYDVDAIIATLGESTER